MALWAATGRIILGYDKRYRIYQSEYQMSHQSLEVNEIFFSIQGESSYAGRPCAFVRLTACNLRCSYCDTEYAFYEGTERSIAEIVGEVVEFPCDLVEITGGEPLLQTPVHDLIRALLELGKTVLIETGGALDVSAVDPRAILIYDIKCPDSGMADKNRWENIALLKPVDEVKFVIGSRGDYQWSQEKIAEYRLTQHHQVLFSPVWGDLEPRQLAEWVLADGLNVRVQIQLHKLFWGAEARGV